MHTYIRMSLRNITYYVGRTVDVAAVAAVLLPIHFFYIAEHEPFYQHVYTIFTSF